MFRQRFSGLRQRSGPVVALYAVLGRLGVHCVGASSSKLFVKPFVTPFGELLRQSLRQTLRQTPRGFFVKGLRQRFLYHPI